MQVRTAPVRDVWAGLAEMFRSRATEKQPYRYEPSVMKREHARPYSAYVFPRRAA